MKILIIPDYPCSHIYGIDEIKERTEAAIKTARAQYEKALDSEMYNIFSDLFRDGGPKSIECGPAITGLSEKPKS